jgi:hypothetical protein
MNRYVFAAVPLSLVLHTAVANADRQAAAAALFEQGIKDMQAGKTALACKELADSIAVWPDSGAKGALAECETALGKTASAWELWHDLATTAPTAELREDAAANAAKLEPRLARVRIRIVGAVPAELEVRLNGKRVSTRSTTPVSVDPGAVIVVATAPDARPWSRTLQAAEAMTTDVDVPLTELYVRDASQDRRNMRHLGLALSVAGGAFIVGGGVLGFVARSNWNSAIEACGGDADHCARTGLERAQAKLDDGRAAARWSNRSIGLGGAVAIAGVILYVRAREPRHTTTAWRISPVAGPHAFGLMLSGDL